MDRKELKKWTKEKVKGNRWRLLGAIIVTSILINFSISIPMKDGQSFSLSIGWLLYFIEVGLTYYLIKFINDEERTFGDIFKFSNDFGKDLLVNLIASIFVFLWSLLLIVPGIIKYYAYSLVPFLLGDEKYNNLDKLSLLKKSEEIMQGHKMDYFVLQLSFIGWHLLAILTLGILEIWIIPYQRVAETKFLYDIKLTYEKEK